MWRQRRSSQRASFFPGGAPGAGGEGEGCARRDRRLRPRRRPQTQARAPPFHPLAAPAGRSGPSDLINLSQAALEAHALSLPPCAGAGWSGQSLTRGQRRRAGGRSGSRRAQRRPPRRGRRRAGLRRSSAPRAAPSGQPPAPASSGVLLRGAFSIRRALPRPPPAAIRDEHPRGDGPGEGQRGLRGARRAPAFP